MRVDVAFWDLVLLLVAFFGCVGAFGRALLAQIEKRLKEQFKAQAEAREKADALINQTLAQHLAEERQMAAQIASLERDFLNWKGELPLNYMRRDDYIRGQVSIEHRQDTIHAEMKVVQLQLERLIGQKEGERQ